MIDTHAHLNSPDFDADRDQRSAYRRDPAAERREKAGGEGVRVRDSDDERRSDRPGGEGQAEGLDGRHQGQHRRHRQRGGGAEDDRRDCGEYDSDLHERRLYIGGPPHRSRLTLRSRGRTIDTPPHRPHNARRASHCEFVQRALI